MTAQLIALTGEDVARLLEPELLISAMEDAFRDLSAGRVSVPPRIAADAGEGSLIAMPGYASGALAAKLISWVRRQSVARAAGRGSDRSLGMLWASVMTRADVGSVRYLSFSGAWTFRRSMVYGMATLSPCRAGAHLHLARRLTMHRT